MTRALAAIVVALLAAASALVLTATPAEAATPPGVTTTVLQNGSPMQPGAEVRTGDSLELRMQYTPDAVGQEVEITLGANVSMPGPFPGNEAVESVTPTANGVTVKFKDPWPAIQEGILDLGLVYTSVTTSGPGDLTWSDGDDHSIPVVFVKDGDVKQNVGDGFAKAVSPGTLDGYVLKDQDGNFQGLSTIAPNDITARDLTYTLTVNTPAGATRGPDFTIADVLPAGLAYVQPLAVTATETTWDENGYNPTTGDRAFVVDSETATHDGFDGRIAGTLTGPSVVKLSYTVRVDDVAALEAALQAAFDAKKPNPGRYELGLQNTATFGGTAEATATVRVGASIAGPCPSCGALGKDGELNTANVLTADDGTILPGPIDLAYTLHADLSPWDGHSPNFVLAENMVIVDTLLPQASWRTGAGFLAVTGSGPISALADTGAACPATAALFAVDANVGRYCLDGNTLMVNVGKDKTTNISIAAPARLNTVAGLPTEGAVENGDRYRVRNTAAFAWGGSSWKTPNVDGYVVVPEADGVAVDDASAFAKTAPGRLSAVPDQPIQVPYVFTVDTARTGVPAASTRIVDHVDTRYFDLPDDLGNVTVGGAYSGGVVLSADDFTVIRPAGTDTLEIGLSATGQAKVTAPNGTLTVNLTLTTRAFDGKETIDITNRAELFGGASGPLYVSQVESQGTSFGAESETRKHIFDREVNGGEWTQVLADDEAEGQVYVYRLQYLAHPGFGGIAITQVNDVLPAGLEFVGFVTEADKATGADPVPGPVDADGGNLVATFVPAPAGGANGTVQVSQQPNTVIPEGSTANVYFAARVIDDTVSIVNGFGISSTTLVPREPSIDIEKWSAAGEDSGPQYDESGALVNDGYAGDFDTAPGATLTAGEARAIRFTVSNDGPEALRDVVVSDELVSGVGPIAELSCTFPGADDEEPITGTEWAGPFEPGTQFECEGVLPALAAGETHADTASVTAVGVVSGREVGDEDSWNGTVPAAVVAGMPVTGVEVTGVVALGALGIVGGAVLLLRRRRTVAG